MSYFVFPDTGRNEKNELTVHTRTVLSNQFDVVDIEKALEKLKTGKASGIDGIVKEHFSCLSYAAV